MNHSRTLLLSAAALALSGLTHGQVQAGLDAGPFVSHGQEFSSYSEYLQSDLFRSLGTQCGTSHDFSNVVEPFGGPADCSLSQTILDPQWDPTPGSNYYEIPVVVHVIRNGAGTQGNVTDARVASQILVLNQDFEAILGSNGAPGTDTRVHFYLANEDPFGNPTTGITRSNNDSWYSDSGSYWNTLAWDTSRYMNIYTLNAPQGNPNVLGYVNGFPQQGIAGTTSDRIVIGHRFFGTGAGTSFPFNLGRTVTHEVGHYFGLLHTFQGGCASAASCQANGDLICDTNQEASPTFGCPVSRTSCSLPAPFRNYMDYSDDRCMNQFTPNQANRIRCTIANYRSALPRPEVPCMTNAASVLRNAGSNPSIYTTSVPTFGSTLSLDVVDFTYTGGLMWAYAQPANVILGTGQALLVNFGSGQYFTRNLLGLPFGHADVPVPNDPSICGATAATQAVIFGGGPEPYVLTNAVDITVGL